METEIKIDAPVYVTAYKVKTTYISLLTFKRKVKTKWYRREPLGANYQLVKVKNNFTKLE